MFESLLSTVLGKLELTEVFSNIADNHLLDVSGIILYLSLIVLFFFLTMQMIQKLGCKCGVVLNPATPLSYVESYLEYIDMLTIMTVDIGFAGQKFIDQMYNKIMQAKELREKNGYHYKIQIDGHCNKENYRQLAEAGADVLIVGNAGLFGLDQDLDTACRKMEMEWKESMLEKAV